MDIRLNIYDENNRWVGVDYLTEKGKWMHKWVHKGELERGSWRGRAVGENDINWRYESALAEPSSVPQANELLPHVSNLLPCPFCGGKAETVKCGGTYTTMCMNEECRVMVDTEGDDIEESECNWNTRAR